MPPTTSSQSGTDPVALLLALRAQGFSVQRLAVTGSSVQLDGIADLRAMAAFVRPTEEAATDMISRYGGDVLKRALAEEAKASNVTIEDD